MADETNNPILEQEVDWNPTEIPNETLLLDGTYEMDIEELKKSFSSTGKLMPKARFRVVQPESCKGQSLFAQYVIGSETNPNPGAGAPEWKGRNAVDLGKLLKKSQVQIRGGKGGFDETLAAATHQRITLDVGVRKGKDKNGNPRDENYIKGYFTVGEKQPGLRAATPGSSNNSGGGGSSPAPLSAEEVRAKLAAAASEDE
jgi:hypothetical protein